MRVQGLRNRNRRSIHGGNLSTITINTYHITVHINKGNHTKKLLHFSFIRQQARCLLCGMAGRAQEGKEHDLESFVGGWMEDMLNLHYTTSIPETRNVLSPEEKY